MFQISHAAKTKISMMQGSPADRSTSKCIGFTADSATRERIGFIVDGAERVSASANRTNQHVSLPADTSSAKFGDADTANVSYRGSRVKITSP